MITLIKYILYFIVLNFILNAVFRFNPILGYIIYFGFIIYWFRGFRTRTRSFRNAPPTEAPKPTNRDDVIDVEYTEHKED